MPVPILYEMMQSKAVIWEELRHRKLFYGFSQWVCSLYPIQSQHTDQFHVSFPIQFSNCALLGLLVMLLIVNY